MCISEFVNLTLNWMHREAKFPVISKIARKYLAVPATSVPTQRIFSIWIVLEKNNKNSDKLDFPNVVLINGHNVCVHWDLYDCLNINQC
jgi:hypothetical protein